MAQTKSVDVWALRGQGHVRGIRDAGLARRTAAARARADLAAQLRRAGRLADGAPLVGSVIEDLRYDAKNGVASATARLQRGFPQGVSP